uniref:Uncharacterized protein n=1 Tax=Candidatus Kentrum sp. LPFa TaxID=2126335 RepID=A0A450X9Y9_9GAMM|nr:MAG: hypothetical protein BECKLPF1236A_GA0070988_100328 [Candidatus Kentron sp. LPFa]VFK26095.1 MAG: hypothetical protein BECKLPF1236C_GA0070990_100307 [Candidatus Kentron sp. LPFa]
MNDTRKWIIWTRDADDFARWSGTEKDSFVVVTKERVTAHSDEIQKSPDNPIRALVVNGGRRPFLDKKMPSTPGWYGGARLWMHLGGLPGEPKDSDWYGFFNDEEDPLPKDVKEAFGSIPETKRRAFGSTINGDQVRREIAPKVSKALEKNEDREKFCEDLLALLDKAWGTAEKKSQEDFDLCVVRALFPLYVDSINDEIHDLGVDRDAAWRAAKSNLEFELSKKNTDSLRKEEKPPSEITKMHDLLDKQPTKEHWKRFHEYFKMISKDYGCHFDSEPNWKADFSSPFAIGALS